VSASTLRARFPPTIWRQPRGRIQDHMARTRSAGAEATTAQASIPPLASEPANPSASAVQPSAGPVPGRALRRSSTPPRGCSRSASRGWGLRRKTSRLSEGSGPSSQACPCRLSLSRRHAHPRRKRSHPSTRTRFHPTPLPTLSTSTSGRLSATSLYCKARSLARRRRSKSLLRRLHQHRRLPRTLRRRPSSTPGTPCRPCRLS
jgi:hypothetical protein